MQLGRLVAFWVVRHLLALILILAVLIAGRYLLVPGWSWLQSEVRASREIAAQRQATAEALARFEDYARDRRVRLEAAAAEMRGAPTDRLRQRLAAIPGEVARNEASRLSRSGLALAGLSGRSDRIFDHYRAGAEIALLDRERRSIESILLLRQGRSDRASLNEQRRQAVARFNASRDRWRAAQAEIDRLNRRPLAGPRNLLCGSLRPAVGCTHYRALRAARQQRDAAWAENRSALQTVRNIDRARSALASVTTAADDASLLLRSNGEDLAREARALDEAAGDNWVSWIRRPVIEMLPMALLILALAIFGPLLGKALLYFIVAPAASRRRPVRLLPRESGEVAEAAFASSVSYRIALDETSELLVVPEAVQSSPNRGGKSTQWLLNARMPLSSLASGMVALVRFRHAGGDYVQLTATGDPLAEIGLIDLPEGSAMVVRPRALRGVVHPAGRPVAITRHWRLGHLSAWLTLQLRHLVFHGPCTLLIQGSRGVALERAGAGRGINRAATIAFSAGLEHRVRRSEAFAPYLMGRQDLFNDSFAGDRGYLVYEQMPRAGQRSGLWGRGLAGLGDAALKVVGL